MLKIKIKTNKINYKIKNILVNVYINKKINY